MKPSVRLIAGLALGAALAWLVWIWGFCRFYVGTDQMAVIIAKSGEDLPPGQILARAGQKGVWEDVLGEGRHFLNPVLYEIDIKPVTLIPPGKVGIVTSKVGEELPEGEFLADDRKKGIRHGVLGPGKYRLNPMGYQIDLIDAISIPVGFAGVITSLSGGQAEEGEFAEKNQKGVMRDILQPGLYYVNPKQYKIDVLEIGLNQVSLLGKDGGEVITKGQMVSGNMAMQQLQSKVLEEQMEKRKDYMYGSAPKAAAGAKRPPPAPPKPGGQRGIAHDGSVLTLELSQYVEFPSRDGFSISLDMTVEFELLPDKIAWIFSRYGDLPAVVDKIIMPQITSISRNKGSEYRAKDFIVGEGREQFQEDLTRSLANTLSQKHIIVHNALIRHVAVPMQILDPIRQASIAIQENLTNREKQTTAKKLAELNTELSLIDQRREQVAQETSKIKAEIGADQQKQMAEIHAQALRAAAEIDKDTAKIEADIVRALETARADAVRMVEGEKAMGLQLKTHAFADPAAYVLHQFASGLRADLKVNILHAGDGTLWTDLQKATLGELGGAEMLREKSK